MTKIVGRIAALATTLASGASVAATSPPSTPIAGGALDPRFPGAEIYLEPPVRAKPPAGKACAAAARYVDLVNAGRFRDVAKLYSDDALLLEPMRSTAHGSLEIRAFYERKIGPMRPEVVPVAYLGSNRDCMVELASKIEIGAERRFALVSIDHFTLDARGKVMRMIAFARPARTL